MKNILLFSAFSGSGKTTFLKNLIPYFIKHDYRIGYIKHHHGQIYKNKIKDTGWIHRIGVDRTLLIADDMLVIEDRPDAPDDPLKEYGKRYFSNYHLVIVEGYKYNKRYPKIVLIKNRQEETWNVVHDPNVIAIISDFPLNTSLPMFGFDQKEPLFHFIIDYFKLGN
jgi:molybdopterin-guanine dinucleotide biosynthesis protein B